MYRAWFLSLVVFGLATGCPGETPEGLLPAGGGDGPRVVIDLDARPFPEIPFPNDLATVADSGSPTGRRLNVSLIGPTILEERVRARLDRLAGFSTFAAVTARFDAPLDVHDLLTRHGADLDFSDDAIYLVDLETGEPVALDVGYGAYPYTLERPDRYFPNDRRVQESNLVFETVDEDANGNGLMDPGEDTDGDGVLDRPNTLTPGGHPIDDLMTFYESETDSLIARPLVPLRQEHTYAVVLTDRLVGKNGQSVRSPYPFINHTNQTAALRPLVEQLSTLGGGLSLEQVAFCWTFTTQSTTRDLEALRMGLYGQGPFAWLADDFPAETELESVHSDPDSAPINPYVVQAAHIQGAMRLMAQALFGDSAVTDALVDSYDHVELLVLGRAQVPQLLQSVDDIWEVNAQTGEARVIAADLPWILTLPKERPELGITRPFPLAIYVHGTGGSRMESLGFAGQLAKFGIATLGLDVYMHGLVLGEEDIDLFTQLFDAYGYGPFIAKLIDNRTLDINKDGRPDEAGNFWSYDIFRSRDSIRQGALDVIRLIQVFRGFDGIRTWSHDLDGDGRPEFEGLAGDFDGDGQVDVGGPDAPFYLTGISLGGIVASVAAPLEPAVRAAAPISSGGGLSDVAIRSLQTGVPELVVLPLMGPILYNRPTGEHGWELVFYLADGRFEAPVAVHDLPALQPGDLVELLNEGNGEHASIQVDGDGRFRLAVQADVGHGLTIRASSPDGRELLVVETFGREVDWQGTHYAAGDRLVAPAEGFGVGRQTPELRRFIQIAQTSLDAGDPINYAPYYLSASLYEDYPGVHTPTRLALILTAGDMNVPISTGISQGRAAGLIPYLPQDQDARYGTTPQRVLVDHWVNEGIDRLKRFDRAPWNDGRDVLLDPDDLAQGLDGFNAPKLDQPLRLGFTTDDGGEALVRFFYVQTRGAHGIGPSNPDKVYNLDLHVINAIGRYFKSGGVEWSDEPCQADDSCEWIPAPL